MTLLNPYGTGQFKTCSEVPGKYQGIRFLVSVQSEYMIRTASVDKFKYLYQDWGSSMSNRKAWAEAGLGALPDPGLRSVSQAEAKIETQCGTEVWAQVPA